MFINETFENAISSSGLITKNEYYIFRALVSYINPEKSITCFPSIKAIAEKAYLSISTVKRGLISLEKKNIITRKHQYRIDKSQSTNLYTVQISGDFWGFTESSKKNKGCHLPSETLYSHKHRTRENVTLAKSYDNPINGICQTENRPETAKTAPAEPKKTRKTAIGAPKETPKEKICMEQIKLDFKYDDLLKACPGNESIIAPLFDVLHRVLNTNKQNIKINKGNQKPTAWVIDRIKRLTADNLAQIIERIAAGTEKIKNIGAYLLTCLCGFIDVAPINKQRATNAETVAPGADHENMTASAAEPDSINNRAGQSTTAARSNTLAYYQRRQQPTALRAMIEHVNRKENVIDLDAMLSADPYRFRRPRTAPTV